MLSTIWLDVLQFSTRADVEAIQLACRRLNASVATNYKSLPLRPFTFLQVNDIEQTIYYHSASSTETDNASSDTFDRVLRKLSNGYVEQFQIDCFCSESFGLYLTSQPVLDLIRFGLFRYVPDFDSDLHECMLVPVVALAANQFRPTGFVLSWNGSLNGSAPVALGIPLIRNSMRHLVMVVKESYFTVDTSEFLLDFLFSAVQLETCTILSYAKADVLAQWLFAFIPRFANAQENDHHVSQLSLLRDCRSDDSGQTMQSTLSRRDSQLGFYPRRAALEQEVLQKIEPDESQRRVHFSTTGQGRVSRFRNKDIRKILHLFTWVVEIEQLDEPNRMEDNNKVEFAVIEISKSA